MKKLTKRILSVFLIALLVCTLLPMGAFAEEVAEPQTEEVAEQKVVAVDAVAERGLVSGEKQTCRFKILYVDSSYTLGYNYGDDWNVDYTCQYNEGHSGFNHSMACSVIQEQVNKASGMVSDGWEIVGWAKKDGANPTVFTTYTGTTATQTSYTIWLVAKKTTPPVVNTTFTVNYMDGTIKVDTDTKTSAESSASFTVISTVPTKEGYTFTGWADSQGNAYTGTFTLSADTPTAVAGNNSVTLDLYAQWEKNAAEKTFTVNYYYEKDDQLFKADTQTGTGDSAAFTVISDVPAKDGWTFKGWVDANDTKYDAGHNFDLSASTSTAIATDTTVTLNLYATWTAETPPVDTKTYTVNYVDDDGTTVAADPESKESAAGYAEFTAKGQSDIHQEILDKHTGKVFGGWKDAAGETYAAGADVTVRDPAQSITLIAIWTTGGETPDEPGDEKVSVPGMIKTVNGKTGEGAIGTLKPGDTVGFTLKTNVGEDMMWKKNDDGTKEQVLTENKETGLWEGTYVLTITDTMEGPMTIVDGTIAVTIAGKDASKYVTFTSQTATGFVLNIDCVAALNDGIFTVDDIGLAEVLVTYTAKVNEDAADGAVLKNTASVNGSADSVVTGDVTNPPIEPPHTGGNGTRMFTIGGVLILAAACVLFAVSRKKAKD